MEPGGMLRVLHELWKELPGFLHELPNTWRTLDVDYEPPRVERLWRQVGDYRLMLHRIHPCERALFHPHPWPSAVRIVSGRYEMGVSRGNVLVDRAPPEIARFELHRGSEYEMLDPLGWHYVRPISGPSLSVMVTGKPWGEPHAFDHSKFGGSVEHAGLIDEVRTGMLIAFRAHQWMST